MKALTLALLLSVNVSQVTPQKTLLREPTLHTAQRSKGGRWYLAAGGHAIYCYGPVMTIPDANGSLERVATLCRDGRAVVPLYESPDPVRIEKKEGKAKDTPSRPRIPQM
jgi:hypothetical protein